jgi:hypothetical protein
MAVDFLPRSKSCGIKRAYLESSPSSMMNSIDPAWKRDSSSSIVRPSWTRNSCGFLLATRTP